MATATLLLRETGASSLAALVERAHHTPSPRPLYTLRLGHAHFSLSPCPDEGFESDLDSVSSNGDTDIPEQTKCYDLVDCVCYTDVTYPDILLFVAKNEVCVFRFDDLTTLKNFFVEFTAVKAVANQKAYNQNSAKFNLLQVTDNDGLTHIEIQREVSPKRPERRKKQKAPPPPDVLRGEYVKVSVAKAPSNQSFIAKSHLKEGGAKLGALLIQKRAEPQWTSSMPRRPMSYRYVDTPPIFRPMSDRLFGFSNQLRDFTKEGNLKSVIKKDEGKKKEKKVTFSAYATVQVV